MYKFPDNLYTDVRIESTKTTNITYENCELKQNKSKVEKGAFIRVFDGERWYYSAVTKIENIQKEIDELALMAKRNENIYDNPVIKRMEVNKGENLQYEENNILSISNKDKIKLLERYLPILKDFPEILNSRLLYKDTYIIKEIISSKGTDITFDIQNAYVAMRYQLSVNGMTQNGGETIYEADFNKLSNREELFREDIIKDIDYVKNAVPVNKGIYTCILSPVVAGVFAHESFGHKSESDFMIGDEKMMKEWSIGSKVGSSILNIIDTGCIEGAGYVPYDDEGTIAKENYLIKDGVLYGRLHSAYTAGALDEEITGNSRAMNFEYEPIVRMTTTYIGGGNLTKEELFSGVKEGIYIDSFMHGSGMSTFTIAPSRAYMIRDGKIAEPVKVSVITGNVMSTLNEIGGVSNNVEIKSLGTGGCGKMEQWPLSVGLGGPYVRVNKVNVQ